MVSKPGLPVWEVAIILIALLLLFVVFILWWFMGYNYAFVEPSETVFNTLASTTTTTLLAI